MCACQQDASPADAVDLIACWETSRKVELNGLSFDAVAAKFGAPSIDEIFALSEDGMTEFRIEILNVYPLPDERGRKIREVIWGEGYCNTAVWFVDEGQGWTSFDNIEWSDDTEF